MYVADFSFTYVEVKEKTEPDIKDSLKHLTEVWKGVKKYEFHHHLRKNKYTTSGLTAKLID